MVRVLHIGGRQSRGAILKPAPTAAPSAPIHHIRLEGFACGEPVEPVPWRHGPRFAHRRAPVSWRLHKTGSDGAEPSDSITNPGTTERAPPESATSHTGCVTGIWPKQPKRCNPRRPRGARTICRVAACRRTVFDFNGPSARDGPTGGENCPDRIVPSQARFQSHTQRPGHIGLLLCGTLRMHHTPIAKTIGIRSMNRSAHAQAPGASGKTGPHLPRTSGNTITGDQGTVVGMIGMAESRGAGAARG